jgi:hypothetical protein
MQTIRWVIVFFVIGLLAAGCASSRSGRDVDGDQKEMAEVITVQSGKSVKVSGFLGDYSKFHEGPEGGPILFYEKEPDALRGYRKFIIDPILIYFKPEAKGFAVDPDKLDKLSDTFRNAVIEELEKGGAYQVVEEPGPGVAHVRIAITDVKPVRMGAGGKTGTIIGGSILIFPGAGLLFPNLSTGEAGIEAEVLDTVSNERLAAVIDHKSGRRFFNIRGALTWGDVKKAFGMWARQFRQYLDDLHEEPEDNR